MCSAEIITSFGKLIKCVFTVSNFSDHGTRLGNKPFWCVDVSICLQIFHRQECHRWSTYIITQQKTSVYYTMCKSEPDHNSYQNALVTIIRVCFLILIFCSLKKNLFKNVLTFLQSINSAEPSLHSVSKTIRKERHFNRSQKFEPMTTDMLTKPSLNFVSYIKHVLHNWSVHL